MKRKPQRRRRIQCRYCRASGVDPCEECHAACLAMRASKGRGEPKIRRAESKSPVESAHVMALVDEVDPLPLIPHFGYRPRGTSERRLG